VSTIQVADVPKYFGVNRFMWPPLVKIARTIFEAA